MPIFPPKRAEEDLVFKGSLELLNQHIKNLPKEKFDVNWTSPKYLTIQGSDGETKSRGAEIIIKLKPSQEDNTVHMNVVTTKSSASLFYWITSSLAVCLLLFRKVNVVENYVAILIGIAVIIAVCAIAFYTMKMDFHLTNAFKRQLQQLIRQSTNRS